jgi:hypothetical protein
VLGGGEGVPVAGADGATRPGREVIDTQVEADVAQLELELFWGAAVIRRSCSAVKPAWSTG